MASAFLSPPAKRAMPDPTNGSSPTKRSKPPPPSLPVPPGHVSFRLLCHASRIGGVIGKSGAVIKQLQLETCSKIRIEDAPPESLDRVITIIAPGALDSGKEEGYDVSMGQEALVRVFERILEVAAESDKAGMATAGGVVSCRLLAEAKHVGSVIGKGGKVVEKIRKDCGVKIRVFTENLPVCAGSTEEVVEIEGDILSVKKALIMVSGRLQECQPVDKARSTGSRPIVEAVVPQLRINILPQQNSLLLPSVQPLSSSSNAYAPVFAHPLLVESDRAHTAEPKVLQQEVVFRILCSNDRVGSIIGKGGSVIKGLQNDTGATISIGPTMAECDERLITITATESPESRYSAAQKTVVLVFSRSMDAAIEKGLNSGLSKSSPVTARLVVSPNQVGCLLGKGGTIISEMRKVTGTGIRIIGGDQVPKCVPANDNVVQISGETMNVKDAIYHVTGRLRDNLFSGILTNSGARGTSLLTEGLRDSLLDSSREPLQDPIREPVVMSLREPVQDQFRGFLQDSLGEPLQDTMKNSFRNPMRDPLSDILREPLRDTLRDPLQEPSRDPTSLSFQPSVGIRHNLRHTMTHDPLPLALQSSVGVPHAVNRHTKTQSMDHLGLSRSLDPPHSPGLWESPTTAHVNSRSIADANRGLASVKSGFELGSGNKSAFVTNTTVEIVVPENVFGYVYGENGSNLARLRQISGAKVIVHESRLGTSDRIIVISGTPDETQAAQSLLQAFILTGQ